MTVKQPQDRRPSLVPKTTRKTEDNRRSAFDDGLKITVPDMGTYEVRVGDVNSNMERELRAATGMSLNGLMTAIKTDPGIDLIAAFVWLARRVSGEHVAFEAVEMTYNQLLDEGFAIDLPDEVSESPEA